MAALYVRLPGSYTTSRGTITRGAGSDLPGLYNVLTYCVKWIAANVSSPAASTPTPRPIVFHTPLPGSQDPWAKPVYVLALASDPALSAQISLQLANNLRAPAMHPDVLYGETPPPSDDIYSARHVRYVVVAAPAWKLADFQQQCFSDPSTAGAIVAVQPGTQSSAVNAILFGISWTASNMQLMVLDCEPTSTTYLKNAAYITWLSHVRTGTGRRFNVSLTTLLGGLAVYFAFQHPETTTYNVRPPKPLPSPGLSYEHQYMISNTAGSEATTAVGVASAFGSQTLLGQSPSVDAQTAGAMAILIPRLIDDLMYTCTRPKPGESVFPQPQCFWFSYRPTARPRP